MRFPRRHAILPLLMWLVVPLVDAAHGQMVRQVSASRVIALTPALRDGHQPPVISDVAIQPQGRLVATVGDDHIVRVWNLADGSLLHELNGHEDWVRCAAFSPDGRLLATAGNDRRITFWNAETGDRQKDIQTSHAVSTIVYSPDGKLLAVAGFGGEVQVYDTVTDDVVHRLVCPCHDMRCVAFSHDGSRLAAAGRDGHIHVWQMPEGNLVYDVRASGRRIRGLTFSHDGRQIVAAGEDRMIRVFAADRGDELFAMSAQPAKVLALVAYAPQRLATAGSDNEIHLWDLATRRATAKLSGHTGSVAALDCEGEILVSGSFDTTVRIWQIKTEEPRDDRAERGDGRQRR